MFLKVLHSLITLLLILNERNDKEYVHEQKIVICCKYLQYFCNMYF
jgi:hypothetical protein